MTAAAQLPRARKPGLKSVPAGTVWKKLSSRSRFGRGRVTLSSGKESDFDPEGAHLIAERIVHEVEAVGAEFVGGLEMGAVRRSSSKAAAPEGHLRRAPPSRS
jgi:hypothetical protein